MKKTLQYIGLLTASVTLCAASAHAGVPEAVDYIASEDSSAMNAIALIAAGDTPDIVFLKDTGTETAIAITKPILAIVAAGEDPRTYPNENLVESLKNLYDGTQMGDSGAVNDDIWAILALISAGEGESEEVVGMLDFVRNNQNMDGGWSWAVEGSSDTDDTAAAVMALVAGGVSGDDQAITDARAYIASNQNEDGGFYSNPDWGTESNSASTAWVVLMLNTLDEDPLDMATVSSDPLTYLASLQDDDGGYWWVPEGMSEWNNKNATADIVLGLLGLTLPTTVMDAPANGVPVTYRIEGSGGQLCIGDVVAVTALDVIRNASTYCAYSYTIDDTDWGPYLSEVGGDAAAGEDGWLYFVNAESALVGAAEYILSAGDDVLWYYGGWGWVPTRVILESADTYAQGDELTVTVEYFDAESQSWLALADATVNFNGDSQSTDGAGESRLVFAESGIFEIVANKDGYVRSNTASIVVGEASQSVSLVANIVQSSGSPGESSDETIGFTVSPASLDFGDIVPGKSATQNIALRNVGTVPLSVGAHVDGNPLFSFIKIAGEMWSLFETFLNLDEEETHEVSLAIPTSYTSYGTKDGSLIFWGQRVE